MFPAYLGIVAVLVAALALVLASASRRLRRVQRPAGGPSARPAPQPAGRAAVPVEARMTGTVRVRQRRADRPPGRGGIMIRLPIRLVVALSLLSIGLGLVRGILAPVVCGAVGLAGAALARRDSR